MSKKRSRVTSIPTARTKRFIFYLIGLVVLSTSVLAPQVYLAENPQVNLTPVYFVEGVLVPIVVASLVFLVGGRPVLWLAFMAYIWSLTEDSPVYLDSVFTWPEVTSGFQHFALEAIFHFLTLLFIILAIRQALKPMHKLANSDKSADAPGVRINGRRNWTILLILVLGLIAFVLSYAQNLPVPWFEGISGSRWYLLDLLEHLASILFLYSAIRIASTRR